MRKRVQIAPAVLLVAITGVIAWQVVREREPVYQGKALSVWLQKYIRGSFIGLRPEPTADEAVRQIAALRDPDSTVRKHAVWTLEGFGAEAELAVPALTQSLVDSNFFMSTDVSNALKAIDPEAATKAGVK